MNWLAPILFPCLAVTLSSCAPPENQAADRRKAASRKGEASASQEASRMKKQAVKVEWAKGPCASTSQLPELKGLTAEEVTARLGEAERKESFLLGERQDEFHVVLQNTFPLSKRGNRKLPIQEWTWTKGTCRLTVWLHEEKGVWKSFENSRYPAAAEF
jgi:hypothetical protein